MDFVYEFFSFVSNITGSSIKLFELDLFFIADIFTLRFRLEKFFEMFQSFFRLCDDHESVRVLVEPVEESSSDEISDGR